MLRVLQEQEFERLGGNRTHKVDVRLIAATHRDLAAMVRHGAFREELYYRLKVFPINAPALRQRTEDIPTLVSHFTALYARRMNKGIDEIPSETMDALEASEWVVGGRNGAAERLGMKRTSLVYRMKKVRISRPLASPGQAAVRSPANYD